MWHWVRVTWGQGPSSEVRAVGETGGGAVRGLGVGGFLAGGGFFERWATSAGSRPLGDKKMGGRRRRKLGMEGVKKKDREANRNRGREENGGSRKTM